MDSQESVFLFTSTSLNSPAQLVLNPNTTYWRPPKQFWIPTDFSIFSYLKSTPVVLWTEREFISITLISMEHKILCTPMYLNPPIPNSNDSTITVREQLLTVNSVNIVETSIQIKSVDKIRGLRVPSPLLNFLCVCWRGTSVCRHKQNITQFRV